MPKMIFVNLPVADVARSTAFYEAVGAVSDPRFSQDGVGAMVSFSDAIHLMLLSPERYADFTTKTVPDARSNAQMLIFLSEDSRAAVDETLARALAAGATADPSPIEDYGWMYGRSFEDPDGHMIGLTWMDVDAAMAAMDAAPDARAA